MLAANLNATVAYLLGCCIFFDIRKASVGNLTVAEDYHGQMVLLVHQVHDDLVLLQELYLSQEDTLRAREMLMEIRKIPVNEKNRNMVLLRERAERHDPVNPIPEMH